MSDVAFIGTGAMGLPIARNLLAAGHAVSVWNRSPGPVDELVAAGARRVQDAAAAFAAAPFVLSMLGDDTAVAETILDSGALADARPGGVHVNLSTVSTGLARRALAAHEAAGVDYVAAPVFGRVPVAQAGNLTIVAGGRAEAIDRVQPLFDVIGARTFRTGPDPASANAVKISGNFLLACAIESLGEAVSLAESFDVDAEELVQILTASLFSGPAYANYGAMIAGRTYSPAGFTVTLGRKDVHLALDAAAEHGITLPVGEVLRSAFDDAIAAGRGNQDWAAIGERLPRRDRAGG